MSEDFRSGIRPVIDRLKLFATGVLGRRNEEVRTFPPSHPDSQVLATLTATDPAVSSAFDSSFFLVGGGVDRVVDYFVTLGGVIIVQESHAGFNLVAIFHVKSGAGTFDKDMVIRLGGIDEDLRNGQEIGITAQADQAATPPDQLLSAVYTTVVSFHVPYLFLRVRGTSYARGLPSWAGTANRFEVNALDCFNLFLQFEKECCPLDRKLQPVGPGRYR